jgi:WXXGXW repeat (2 copies)
MSRLGITSGLLLLFAGTTLAQTSPSLPPPPPPGNVSAPVLEGPTTDLEPIQADNAVPENSPATAVTSHDAVAAPVARGRTERVYAPKAPPAPITERPSGTRPRPQAVWVSGYWDWDAARSEFYWMGGVWQVPAPGSMWVAGRWMHDQNGWYRSTGVWSRRRVQVVVPTEYTDATQPAWQTTGPPADHPVDQPTAAPGPDYFFVPGHYAPDGDQVVWKTGFWARSQPDWDWVPARWVRRAAGWEFRAGHWVREPDAMVDVNVRVGEPRPGRTSGIDRPAPPPGSEDEMDPIAEAEAAARGRRELGPIVVVPRVRMPYYVIRPPGMYPYGPSGVVVPGAVPGFVRDILDRVLP